MTIEAALTKLLEHRLAPLEASVERLAFCVENLRSALPPQLVTLAVAAERLGLSLSTVRRRVADGSLRTVRLGRSVRVDLESARIASDDEVRTAVFALRR